MYDVFFHPHPTEEGGYLIDHDSRTHDAPPLLTLLKRYVLRSKVRIKAVHEEWDLWSVFGGAGDGVSEEATWRWAKSGSVEPVWKEVYVKEGVERGMVDQRAPMMGRRVLVRKGDLRTSVSVLLSFFG